MSVKIENEQLKKDNSFLVELLRSTKKFGELADYIKDSGGASKMDSLAPPNPFTEHRRCYQGVLEKKKMDEVFSSQGVEDELIPTEAFKAANIFRTQHGNDLSPELINQLLQNLNMIWREREKKAVARAQKKFQDERQALRRQMQSRQPYDAIQ